jgi:hypothetical protein
MRRQLDNLEERMDIYDRNINLHLNLIGRIQQVEAMSLAGVDEAQIDDIILDFETHFEQYTETVAAGEAAITAKDTLKSASDNELAELESEIKGETEPQPKRAGEKELKDLEKEILADKPRAKKKRKAEADGEA